MRTVLITTIALLVMSVLNTTHTAQVNGAEYAGYEIQQAYGAPACAAPAYCGPLVPGCCEYPPSCRCDDIWAGYCQGKNQGCGFPIIRIPVISGPCKRSYCQPRVAPARCGPGAEAQCAEPSGVRPIAAPADKPAPAIKYAPKAAAENIPSPKAAPAKPQPDKEEGKASSTRKSSSAWRFLPAGNSLTR